MSRHEDRTHTQEQLAVIKGLKQLRRVNRWWLAPLTEEQISSPEVEAYLKRDLDADPVADAQLEKDLVTAIYLSVKRSKWKPRQSAKLLARQAIEELRAARLTALYHDNRISAKRYQEECANNYVQNALVVTKRVVKRYGYKALKGGLTLGLLLAGLPHAAVAAGGLMLVNALIPKKYKEKIKAKVKEIARTAVATVQRGLTHLKEKGRQVATQAASAIVKVTQAAQRVAEPVVEAVKSALQTVKEGTKKVFRFLFRR